MSTFCSRGSSRQQNFMSEYFLGSKILWPETRQDFQKEAHHHLTFPLNHCYQGHTETQNFVVQNDLGHKELASKHFLRDNLNLFGAEKVLIEKLLVSKKMLRGKFLVSEIIINNKISCLSMSSDKISDKQKQNSNSYSQIDDAQNKKVLLQETARDVPRAAYTVHGLFCWRGGTLSWPDQASGYLIPILVIGTPSTPDLAGGGGTPSWPGWGTPSWPGQVGTSFLSWLRGGTPSWSNQGRTPSWPGWDTFRKGHGTSGSIVGWRWGTPC